MKSFLLSLLFFSAVSAHAQTVNKDSIYEQVDSFADFDGGAPGWTSYLIHNLTYPQEAMNKHITGTVTLQFVVNEKGRVSNIRALSGPEILQQEGIRLIKASPRWTPATKDGEKVKSYKRQNISFRLEGSLYNQ